MNKYKNKQLAIKEKKIHLIKIYMLGILALILFYTSFKIDNYEMIVFILANMCSLGAGILYESYRNKYTIEKEGK